ncbi:MAG: hypothetical protein AVDCRST_MAG19-1194, partial [uncultured Thermomicrobiales bacterium]
ALPGLAGAAQPARDQPRARATRRSPATTRRRRAPGADLRPSIPDPGAGIPGWRRLRDRAHLRPGPGLGEERPRRGRLHPDPGRPETPSPSTADRRRGGGRAPHAGLDSAGGATARRKGIPPAPGWPRRL